MLQSVVTLKGQTTIPKEIRDLLKLKPNDRLFYLVEEGKVILKPPHGDILELRGSVTSRERPEDFDAILARRREYVLACFSGCADPICVHLCNLWTVFCLH